MMPDTGRAAAPAVVFSASLCLNKPPVTTSRDPFLECAREPGLEPPNERAGDGVLDRVFEFEIMRGPCGARVWWCGWFGSCGERVPLATGSGREACCTMGLL